MKTAFVLATCLSALLVPSLAFAAHDSAGSADRASADEDEKPSPETKPAVKEKPMLGPQGAVYTAASVSASPYILLGWFPAKDLTIAGGLGLSVNANGSALSPLTGLKGDSSATVGSDLVLAIMYFVVDKFPFAMGPEVVVIGSVAPGDPFSTTIIEPMWGLRYAPWAAPVAIGTDLGLSIAMAHNEKPVAGLTTTGLDIVFAF